MASFKELRKLLVTCYDSKIISDEEFLTLNDSFQSENPDFDYESYPVFDLQLTPTFRSTSLISLLYPCTGSLRA